MNRPNFWKYDKELFNYIHGVDVDAFVDEYKHLRIYAS